MDNKKLKFIENTLRIKITGCCNRKCSFCHEEGGMDSISEIYYNDELKIIIDLLNSELGIDSIALTGGEPLLHNDLYNLVSLINNNTQIHRFSLTTNGTLQKDYEYWHSLYNEGLYKVNISMPDIIEFHNYTSSDRLVNDVFKNQAQLISVLNKIGIDTKINIVIFNDVLFTKNNIAKLLYFRDALNIEIVLLPNLINPSTFAYSQKVIDVLRSDMRLKKVESRRRIGTSNSIEVYKDNDGDENGKIIYIKSTKMEDGNPYMLQSLCGQCHKRKMCQEGFYGLRLEKTNNKFYIRLCIHKDSPETLLTLDDFLRSAVFKELKALWIAENEII